jgi:hypothetical protein
MLLLGNGARLSFTTHTSEYVSNCPYRLQLLVTRSDLDWVTSPQTP